MISTLQTNFHVKPKKFKKSSGITTKMKFKFFKKNSSQKKHPLQSNRTSKNIGIRKKTVEKLLNMQSLFGIKN